MTAKDFVLVADALEIPEALDLTTAELNVIKAASDSPFDLISLGFKCGFMRGQKTTATDRAIDRLELAEFKIMIQKIHSVVLALACALDCIVENGCEPAQFVPALYGVEADLNTLEGHMEAALDQKGRSPMVKIHISYTPDDEATAAQAVAYLKGILPALKVKKTQGKVPYNNVYFMPPKAGEPAKIV